MIIVNELIVSTKEFQVNEFLTVKLVNKQIHFYIKGELFKQCKFLLLNYPSIELGKKAVDENNLRSGWDLNVDTIAEKYNWTEEGQNIEGKIVDISQELTPEEIFWAYCSNLQVWAESGYSGDLLHSHIAFPLLRTLSRYDPHAKKKYKEEIKKRMLNGDVNTAQYLVDGAFLDAFSNNEIMKLVLEVQNTPLINSESTKAKMIVILKTTHQWYNVYYRSTAPCETSLVQCNSCEKYYNQKEIAYFNGLYYICKSCHHTFMTAKTPETSLKLNKFFNLLNKHNFGEAVSCINSLLNFNYFEVVQNEFIQSKDHIICIIPGNYLWDQSFIFYPGGRWLKSYITYTLAPSNDINSALIPINDDESITIRVLNEEVIRLSRVGTVTYKDDNFSNVIIYENYYLYPPFQFLLTIIENPIIAFVATEGSPLIIRNNKIRANIMPINEKELPKHRFM